MSGGPVAATRERIVEAAVELATRTRWDDVTYLAIANRAGISRPTLYTYFPSREDLFEQAMEVAAADITARVIERVRTARTAAEFVVELTASCIQEFRDDPTTSAIALVRPDGVLGPSALAVATGFLGPLVEHRPDLEPELEEIAETLIRFLLSFVMFDSARTSTPASLRAYLRRRLVPALGLDEPTDTP